MWKFNPRDPRLGVPEGHVQELQFIFVPRAFSLVTLLALELQIPPGKGTAPLALVELAEGCEDRSIVDPVLQWQLVDLSLMRLASQVARGKPPSALSRVVSAELPTAILKEVVGEHFEALRLTRRSQNGQVHTMTYPVPPGAHRAILLIRDGGPLPS